jgi:multiple antibiotic resistance protein
MLERYIEVAGRITALVVGTFALEMIMQGAEGWLRTFF